MSLPYRITLIAGLLMGMAFFLGPWWAWQQIADASVRNDTAAWQRLVNRSNIQDYTGHLLTALLGLKMEAEMQRDPIEAMRDFQQVKDQLPRMAEQLLEPQSLQQLVCGELLGYVATPAEPHDCWALDGKIQWQSPLLARVALTNPQTHWQSKLVLLRTGLFSWRLDSIELPVEAMMQRVTALAKHEAI